MPNPTTTKARRILTGVMIIQAQPSWVPALILKRVDRPYWRQQKRGKGKNSQCF
jgi:hypothetical protein